MGSLETNERLGSDSNELFTLLDEVSTLIGDEDAMADKPENQPGGRRHVVDVVEKGMTLEEQLRKKQMVRFDTLAELSVYHHMLEREQMERDEAFIDRSTTDPIEEVSLLMTLWQYEQAHLKEHVYVLQQYRVHLKKYPKIAESLRKDPQIAQWEQQAILSLKRLKQIMPAIEQLYRINKYTYLLELDEKRPANKKKFSEKERQDLVDLVTWLKTSLKGMDVKDNPAFKGIDLPEMTSVEEYRSAGNVLEGGMRTILAETVDLGIRGTGKIVRTKRTMRLGQALYLRMLTNHRDASIEGIKNVKTPTIEQYNEFLEVQGTINTISLQHVVREMKHNADMQSLLGTMTYFGPRTREGVASNPQAAKQFAEYFNKYVLPEEIKDQFKLKEFARHQAGMEGYLQLVEGDVLRYGKWVDGLESLLIAGVDEEKTAIQLKQGVGKWSYFIPEHTLGYLRLFGFDYAEVLGQRKGLDNTKAIDEFMKLEEDTKGIAAILTEQKPGIVAAGTEVRAASKAYAELRKKHPPTECQPGKLHGGETFEAIEKQYAEAITRVREAHKAYAEKIDAFYQELEKIIAFHINRMAQHRLLNAENSPNPIVGIGITAGEALTVAAYWYGGKRGLRAVPGIAKASGLGWVKSRSGNPVSWLLKRIVNAPIRIVNAPTRLLIDSTPLRWVVPRSRLDGAAREIAAVERQVSGLERQLADANTRIAELESRASRTATSENGPRTRRGREAAEALSRNTRAQAALTRVAQIEDAITAAKAQMQALLTERSTGRLLEGEFVRRSEAIRDSLTKLNSNAQVARIKAAKAVIGKRLPFLPSRSRAIMQAHAATSVAQKKAILEAAKFKPKHITALLESGVCGNAEAGLSRMRNVTSPAVGASDEVVSAFARVGTGVDDVLIKSGRTATASSRSATEAEKKLLKRWWKTPALKKILHYGGIAIQGYIVYSDLMALDTAEKHHASAKKMAKKHLDDLVAKKIFTKEGDTYKYKDKVSIRLDQIGSRTAVEASNWRLATDAATLGIMISMGPKFFAGPVGWILIGAEVTIHIGISAWEYSEYYEFVQNVDPALLAYLGGTQATVGKTEFDLLEDKFVDLFISNKTPAVRKKIVYSWYMTHLARTSNKDYNEIVGARPYQEMSKFYREDFSKYILPFLYTNLLLLSERADNSMDFISGHDVTRYGFNMIFRKDMEASFYRATDWYILHYRERKYLDALRAYENERDPLIKQMLASQVYEFGSKYVFGGRLMDAKDDLLKNNGKTRIELLASRMKQRLINATQRGTWLDAMKSNSSRNKKRGFILKHNPRRYTDGTTTPVLSTNRDFTFNIEDIYGISRSKEFAGRAWYSDIPRSTYTPIVSKVSDAISSLTYLGVPDIYSSLHGYFNELNSSRSYLLNKEGMLLSMNAYIVQSAKIDVLNGRGAEVQKQIDALHVKLGDIDRRGRQSGYGAQFGAAPKRRINKELVKLAELKVDIGSEKIKEEKTLVEMQVTAKSYKYDYAKGKQKTTAELSILYGKEYAAYLLDLQSLEHFTEEYTRERVRLIRITEKVGQNVSLFDIKTGSVDSSLTNTIYPDMRERPVVLYSGSVSSGSARYLKYLAEYPYLDILQGTQAKHYQLIAIHFDEEKKRNGDVEYFATYTFSRRTGPNPDKNDVFYFQLGGIRRGGSGYLEIGLPVQKFEHQFVNFPETERDVYFRTAIQALKDQQQNAKADILAKTDRTKRLFRAGDIMNELVQVSRNEWAVRFLINGKHVFHLVRLNADGTLQSKRLEYDFHRGNMRQIALTFLKRDVAYKQTGSVSDREYTDAELNFAAQLEKDLAVKSWGMVPKQLVSKFNLQSDPYKFINTQPLPFQGFMPGLEPFGGIDGIVDKLRLRQEKPGLPGLDIASIKVMKDVIKNMVNKLDAVSPAESGGFRNIFMDQVDIQLSVRADEIRRAAPNQQMKILHGIMIEAAKIADAADKRGARPVSNALYDAFQSEGWGG